MPQRRILTGLRVPVDQLDEIDRRAKAAGLTRTDYMIRASLGLDLATPVRRHRRDDIRGQPAPSKRAEGSQRAWRQVLLSDPCAYCGKPSVEIDHIVPQRANGEHEWTNLSGICHGCNRIKKNRTLLSMLSGLLVTSATSVGSPRDQTPRPGDQLTLAA